MNNLIPTEKIPSHELEILLSNMISWEEKLNPDQWLPLEDFKNSSSLIGEFLSTNYSDLYEFIKEIDIVFSEDAKPIMLKIENNLPVIYINPHNFTKLLNEIKQGNINPNAGFDLIAGLFYHVMFHYLFKHFRLPAPEMYDQEILHYAQDIIVDNFIRTKIKNWRNWNTLINLINEKISENNLPFKKISLGDQIDEEYIHIFDLTDTDIYVYLNETLSKNELKNSSPQMPFDDHKWNEPIETSHSIQKTKNSSYQYPSPAYETETISNFYDHIISKLKEKSTEIINDPLLSEWKNTTLENLYQQIDRSRTYDLYNILRRYVRKLSIKIKQRTWRKIHKRYPFTHPGNIYKKEPGEILLIVDISKSMHSFLKNYLPKIYNDIYNSFEKISKIYAPISKTYVAQVSDKIEKIDVIKNIDELKNINFYISGGTDYTEIFKYIRNWRANTKSLNELPDLIIFVSDFHTDSINELEKSAPQFVDKLNKNLLWIYTGYKIPKQRPKFGQIICAFSFFHLNERR
jgi:predicted metal-dependent peptidase